MKGRSKFELIEHWKVPVGRYVTSTEGRTDVKVEILMKILLKKRLTGARSSFSFRFGDLNDGWQNKWNFSLVRQRNRSPFSWTINSTLKALRR